MYKKCKYCGKEHNLDIDYCSEGCMEETENMLNLDNIYIKE